MTKKKKISVVFSADVNDIADINESFAKAKMHVAYAGINRNGSSISKEVFEDAIPTMYNCPVVGRYIRATDSFGSHDSEVIIKGDELHVVNATQPLGVIPEGASVFWESVDDVDYLTVEPVILWKRQEAYAHIEEVSSVDISMECYFTKYHMSNNITIADKMYFEAFTLLESAEPCFEKADIAVFSEISTDDFKQQYTMMLSAMDGLDYQIEPDKLDFDINNSEKGGQKLKLTDERRDEILAEKSISLDDIDFEIADDETEESFTAKVDEFLGRCGGGSGGSGGAGSTTKKKKKSEKSELDDDKSEFASTYEQRRSAIENSLDHVEVRDESDCLVSYTDYWLMDFDDDYAMVGRYICNCEAGDYTRDQGRFAYDYDDDTKTVTIMSEFEPMIIQWLTLAENKKLEDSRDLFKDLMDFKNARLEEDRKNTINEVLEDFHDLDEVEEFSALKEKAYEYEDIESLKDKCFAIRGKQVKVAFSKKLDKAQSIKVPVTSTEADADSTSEEYGDLFTRFSVE